MTVKGPGLFFPVVLSFSLLFVLSGYVVAGAADFTVETIQKAYENIKDIKGNFVQKSTIKDLRRTDTFKGSLVIKVPSKMRWQYHGDDKQNTEVIVSNSELIIYQKSEQQAFRGKFDAERYGQAPIALLAGFGNVEKEFEVTPKEGKLLMKPRREMGGVVSIEVSPATKGDFPIGGLTIVDRRSNRIDITFKDIVLNSGVKDGAFSFSVPEGVSVYEYSKPQ